MQRLHDPVLHLTAIVSGLESGIVPGMKLLRLCTNTLILRYTDGRYDIIGRPLAQVTI